MRGYNVTDDIVRDMIKIDSHFAYGAEMSKIKYKDSTIPRRVVGVTNMPVPPCCPPHPNPGPVNQRLGAAARVMAETPTPVSIIIDEMATFVKEIMIPMLKLEPLKPEADLSVETWLSGTNYTEKRKQMLRDLDEMAMTDLAYAQQKEPRPFSCLNPDGSTTDIVNPVVDERYVVSAHQKAEFYPNFKKPRGIYSRSDSFKILVGPAFKLIEKEVFKLPWFIKNIPVKERISYMKEKLHREGAKYVSTDFSTMEASIRAELMLAIEYPIYEYMLSGLPDGGKDILEHIKNAILGKQHITFNLWQALMEARRESGEMNTSLGNGIQNLATNMFTMWKMGLDPILLQAVFEGDDGLILVPEGLSWPSSYMTALGYKIKMVEEPDWQEAGFCGNIFNEESNIIVTEPMYVLCVTPWVSADYALSSDSTIDSIMRSKALSIIHQYPGHPILQEFAMMIMRKTKGRSVRRYLESKASLWEKSMVYDALRDLGLRDSFSNSKLPLQEVSMGSRLLVERKYGIGIDRQLMIESYFRSDPKGRNMPSWIFGDEIHPDWYTFADHYRDTLLDESSVKYPSTTMSGGPPEIDPEIKGCIRKMVLETLDICLDRDNPCHAMFQTILTT